MDDAISRQDAITAHCELCSDKGKCNDICPDVEVFQLIPAQPKRTENAQKTRACDCIDRQAAVDAIFSEPLYESGMKKRDADAVVPAIYEKIKSLPSAQPERTDCTDCAEYDHERHSCPKYCDVIRQTLAEAKQERTECNKCKEYDNERHSCPHYCEVMRPTADGIQIETYCKKPKLPEEVQEPTLDQIVEYCKKRCLTICTTYEYK